MTSRALVVATSLVVCASGSRSGLSTAAPLRGFDAVALGDGFPLAWGNDPAGNPASIMLSVFDQNGTQLAEASLPDRFHTRLCALAGVRIVRFDSGESP